MHKYLTDSYLTKDVFKQTYRSMLSPGNKNKGKGNGAGLAWKSQLHCFANEFLITHGHFFVTDTQHDFRQGNCRTICRQ